MLSKISVKKPYTVVVGIVLILILGVVSFMNMTADLLPDINLPYAVVITAYPGASPSEVEEYVTREIEESMATVSNIESVQSVSRENMSLVVLQFEQSTSMDSASLEMREKLDQIGSDWDDMVGSPIIMKINPDMLPVMVAAVEQEGLSNVEISNLVDAEILAEIESLEGVASVSVSGQVEESLQVFIRQEKVDKMNQKVQDAVSAKFVEAQTELNDAKDELAKAQKELDSGKAEADSAQSQIDSGKAELENGKSAMTSQIGSAHSQLNEAQNTLLENELDIREKLSAIETGLTQLQTKREEAEALEETLDKAEAALEQLAEMEEQEQQLTAGIAELETNISALEELEESVKDIPEDQIPEEIKTNIEMLKELKEKKAELEVNLSQLQIGLLIYKAQSDGLNPESIAEGRQQLKEGFVQMDEAEAQMKDGKAQLEAALTQISAGKTTVNETLAELNSQEIAGVIEMASAQAQLTMGEAQAKAGKTQIESGQKQLDEGKEQLADGQEQLDEARQDALEGADLNDIITSDLVSQILMAQNFSMPAGYITEDNIKYLVRVGDKFENSDEMTDLVLFDFGLDGLAPIKLSDVADISVVDNSAEVYAKINGEAGVILTIQKQTGYATGDVSDRIADYFEDAKEANLGRHFTILMDQGVYIDMVVNSVIENLLYGAVLAVIILFIFLWDIRPTFIVACSIPFSVLTAIVLMYFSGINLNIISLSGLALGVGMLVDNSIVVIENIYRLRSLGVPPRKAAVEGAKQVAGAIAASTLTTVCVFLPIVFTTGITRQLFVDMGLTIAYSLLASLVIALTLVPMMSAGMLKKSTQKKSRLMERFLDVYARFLEGVLRMKWVVLAVSLVLLLISGYACLSRGMVYIPEMESTQSTITVTMPEGSSLEDAAAMSDEIADRIDDLEDIEEIGAMAGSSGIMSMMGTGSSSSAEMVTMYLILSEKKELTGEELGREIALRTDDLDCELDIQTSSMDLSALGGSGVSVQINGKDLDKLKEIATDVAGILETVEGTAEVSDGQEDTTEEMRIIVNRDKASEYNLTVAQIYQQIAAQITESQKATVLSTDTKDYDVNVEDENKTETTREDLKDFTLSYTDTEGKSKKVAVDEVVEFAAADGLQSILRESQSRYIAVSAEIADGYNVTNVSDAVNAKLKEYDMPDGYSYKMTGEDETIRESMVELMKMLGLAVVFIYLIMVAQFQSLLSPFIVMFTIPLAFTGGFIALFITGKEMSIIGMIGFVMLSGIIVNNGIVLVDYINQLRGEGMEKRPAIVEAGKTRMRPIMMTAMTTILGLLTMAIGVGMGADMVQPMAIVTIGGLLYGTLLTLIVVPCIYDILNRKKYKKIEIEGEEDEHY